MEKSIVTLDGETALIFVDELVAGKRKESKEANDSETEIAVVFAPSDEEGKSKESKKTSDAETEIAVVIAPSDEEGKSKESKETNDAQTETCLVIAPADEEGKISTETAPVLDEGVVGKISTETAFVLDEGVVGKGSTETAIVHVLDEGGNGKSSDEVEGVVRRSPKKKFIREICDTLVVAQALLKLSEASDVKPPDLLSHDSSNDNRDSVVYDGFNDDLLSSDNEEEEVEPYSPRAGETVKLRSDNPKFRCYVVRVDRKEGNILTCSWYYYPEETKEGRLPFHGEMEIFSSGSSTAQLVQTVIGKCKVHTLKEYNGLLNGATEDDFFSRFYYDHINGVYTPEVTEVYCTCEMPSNPDVLMVECDKCSDWFHPGCIGLDDEEAKALNKFNCVKCSSD